MGSLGRKCPRRGGGEARRSATNGVNATPCAPFLNKLDAHWSTITENRQPASAVGRSNGDTAEASVFTHAPGSITSACPGSVWRRVCTTSTVRAPRTTIPLARCAPVTPITCSTTATSTLTYGDT